MAMPTTFALPKTERVAKTKAVYGHDHHPLPFSRRGRDVYGHDNNSLPFPKIGRVCVAMPSTPSFPRKGRRVAKKSGVYDHDHHPVPSKKREETYGHDRFSFSQGRRITSKQKAVYDYGHHPFPSLDEEMIF